MEEKNSNILILDKYVERCSILKQIHSNKKLFNDKWATTIIIITIISSLILTIVGFINKDLLYELFFSGSDKDTSIKIFDFIFNLSVLIVLIISIVNLIFRFQDKSAEHNRAIIICSNLLREIFEIKTEISNIAQADLDKKISNISIRYGTVIDLIPSHSDKDFYKAKIDDYKKKQKSKEIDNKYKDIK